MVLTGSLFAKNDTDYVGQVGVRTEAIRFNKQGYLVVTGNGTWVVVWNQSAFGEAAGDHRIVSSRSTDRGKTWSEPHIIERDRQGCWLSPVYVETQNRIYGFYWHDADGNPIRDAGVIVFRYSDDEGATWSARFPVPMERHAIDVPGKPYRGWNFNPGVMLEDGTCWLNFNKINPDSMVKDPRESKCLIKLYNNFCWTEAFFLVCANIATESDPAKLEFRVSPESPHGLHATHPLNGQNCGDEASVVPLNNGDLYATFRTPTGRPYRAISKDRGKSWGGVRPMTFTPGGKPIWQPNCSCPLVKLRDGRFVFSFNNNPGDANGGTDPWDTRRNRSPLWVAVGREIATQDGELDLEFDRPRYLIANDLSSGGTESTGITYTQMFEDHGEAFIIYTNKSDDVNINRIDPNLLQFGAKVTIPDDQISWLEKRIETLRSQIGSHRQDMGYTHFFHNLDAAMAEQDYFHAYHLTLNRAAWLLEGRDDVEDYSSLGP